MSEENDRKIINNKNEEEKTIKTIVAPQNTGSLINVERFVTTYTGLSLLMAGVSIITILFITLDECRLCFNQLAITSNQSLTKSTRKTFWTYGKNTNDRNGHLKEVFTVLERLGYEYRNSTMTSLSDEWDLLWAHDYPFRQMEKELKQLKSYQKINHFPGCGYLTNKVDLSITKNVKYLPAAFKLPEHKEMLLDYQRKNTDKTFLQKSNSHRNIKIVKMENIDLDQAAGTFVQEFIDKPLLINGHKFDIGIYVVVTSIDPLRVYIYNGEALLRFCPIKYYPFDAENLDKYVVGDDYLPIWEVPALDYYYNILGFGMRESLNAYLKTNGRDPNGIWIQIEDAVRSVLLAKEPLIMDALRRYKFKRNFFEMMRFDFAIDENLQVFLLEANMSPNLSSAHFPLNQLLYQQVLYNVFGLIGIGGRIHNKNTLEVSHEEEEMIVSDKHLATFPEKCNSPMCKNSCLSPVCQLCKPCLSPETRQYLVDAFKEHLHRGDCKRVFPPTMTQAEALIEIDEKYSAENQLHYRWFQGKCLLDSSWC